jgi:hypothetical protein
MKRPYDEYIDCSLLRALNDNPKSKIRLTRRQYVL